MPPGPDGIGSPLQPSGDVSRKRTLVRGNVKHNNGNRKEGWKPERSFKRKDRLEFLNILGEATP